MLNPDNSGTDTNMLDSLDQSEIGREEQDESKGVSTFSVMEDLQRAETGETMNLQMGDFAVKKQPASAKKSGFDLDNDAQESTRANLEVDSHQALPEEQAAIEKQKSQGENSAEKEKEPAEPNVNVEEDEESFFGKCSSLILPISRFLADF